jgi:glycosyltransferase involved in cell wall biosynthesis
MGSSRLTVVQLVPALESGGVERGTLEVAGELVRCGHRSIVVSAGGRMVPSLVAAGSEHFTLPIDRKSPLTLRCLRPLRQLLLDTQPAIVHARSRVPAWVGWLTLALLPARVRPCFVTTVHGLYSVNPYSRIMTRGAAVIAVSETIRRYIVENYPGVDPARIRLIPRGVDRREFPYAHRPPAEWLHRWETSLPQLRGRMVVTLAGRITRLKGHHDFVELIDRLKQHGLPVHGLIVGDEDPRRRAYAAEVRREVARRGLAADLTFLGHRSDIREIYAVSSLVVSLSRQQESFGRTTLEPLALGVPVAGYDHGGVGEILQILFPEGAVPVGDCQALAERAAHLLSRPDRRVPLRNDFELSVMLQRTLELYHELAAA